MHKYLAGGSGPIFEQGDDNMLRQKLIRIETPRFFLGIQVKYTLNPLS